MAKVKPFQMDGVSYDVHVLKLTRKFSVLDSELTARVQSGRMYRDIIGTFYNYSMTVASMSGKNTAMDALWDAVSQPVESHMCVFPYNQSTLAQEMYITSGEQDIVQIYDDGILWDVLQLNFIAMEPEVVP